MKSKLIDRLALKVTGGLLAAALALATPAVAPGQAQGAITPNYKDADLGQIIKAVSAVTGKNFIVDPRVRAQVTMVSSKPMSPNAFYELPTYAFQRERYWLDVPQNLGAGVASAGLATGDHPLLGAAVALAESDGAVFTGRLSLGEYPWLASHQVFGRVILPGTAMLELALVAAHRVGLEQVEELTLEAPLELPEKVGVQLQVWTGAADETGRRPLSVHARNASAAS